MQNYLVWMLIMERVSSLSRRMKDVRAHYRKVRSCSTVRLHTYNPVYFVPNISFSTLTLLLLCSHNIQTLHGTTLEEARWRDCVRYVQNNMENAVGALYVRETFAGDSKRMVSLNKGHVDGQQYEIICITFASVKYLTWIIQICVYSGCKKSIHPCGHCRFFVT